MITREEAIKRLKEIVIRDAYPADYKALYMAINALENEPTKEEQALLKKWRDNRGISMEEFEYAMNVLQGADMGRYDHYTDSFIQEPCEDCINVYDLMEELKALRENEDVKDVFKDCDTCKYLSLDSDDYPCDRCKHRYTNQYVYDDKREVNADEIINKYKQEGKS